MTKPFILCFIDDDVELSSLWLFNIDHELKNNSDISLLTGPTLPKFETYPPKWLKNFSTGSIYGGSICPSLSLIDLGNQSLFIDPIFVWGLNFIIKRDVFEFLKGFHPDNIISSLQFFQGDGESGLSLKAKRHGFKAYYSSGVLLYHFIPKERLSYDYFYKRYYYQGVADSFTALRRNAGLYEVICNDSAPGGIKFFSVFIFLKKIKFYVFNFFKSRNDTKNPEHLSMTEALNEGYSAGYNFHQSHFNTNSVVKSWVLKDDYLNYKRPES